MIEWADECCKSWGRATRLMLDERQVTCPSGDAVKRARGTPRARTDACAAMVELGALGGQNSSVANPTTNVMGLIVGIGPDGRP
jgi:hypothetical protein